MRFRLSTLILLCILIGGCIPSGTFEKSIAIPSHKWKSGFVPTFKFEIKDTNSSYQLSTLLRHTDAYPFSNIWINIITKTPSGKISKQKVELPLAQDDGQWTGRGMGEVYEHKISLTKSGSTKFNQQGTYEVGFEQIMRMDPLPEMMSIGLEVNKNRASQ